MLSALALGLTLRPFQERALQRLTAQLEAGERRLHLVAPPGAGKTVLGLSFLLQRGQPAVIASPTATIAAQWAARFREFAIDPLGVDGDDSVARLVGTDPRAEVLPPVLSLTYQALSVRDGEDFHDNVHTLFERLAQRGVRTVILDECHHLKNTWAEAIARFLDSVPEAVVLGLTATPPHDATAAELTRHLALLGEVNHEIPLPALVRGEQLAPWQDLVHLVRPTPVEAGYLADAHARFHQLRDQVRAPAGGLTPLPAWLQMELVAIAAGRREASDWADWLTRRPDEAIALCRVLLAEQMPMPDEAWVLDEMQEPPTLEDQAIALDLYHRRHLSRMADEGVDDDGLPVDDGQRDTARALRDDLREAMRPVGYILTRRGLQRRSSAVDRLLGLSAAKLPGLGQVLGVEHDALGEELRAVVVTDFERASAGRMARTLSGVLDPEAGGAVAVLRYLATHPELGVLDAVMVTGRTLLCDADVGPLLVEAIRSQARAHGWRLEVKGLPGEGHLWEISGSGPDWTSARYVLLVTELFERGAFRCIVGTRGLLGEGWDVRSANVLVDLTAVAAFVGTNQLRGRCLRLDPERPEKVANLWDIVAIAPEQERGDADWQRFLRKHAHVPGLADDGAIESGAGHVHPAFVHLPVVALAQAVDEVNAEMRSRALDRRGARRAWRIGEPFRGDVEKRVELRLVQRGEPGPVEAGSGRAAAGTRPPPEVPGALAARALRLTALEQAGAQEEARIAAALATAEAQWAKERSEAEARAAVQGAALAARVTRAQWAARLAWVLPMLVLVGLLGASGTWPAVVLLAAGGAGAAGSWATIRGLGARRRRLVEERPDRLLAVQAQRARSLAAIDAEEQAVRGQMLATGASLSEALAAAREAMTAPVGEEEVASLYGSVIRDAFVGAAAGEERSRWSALAVRTARRADGSVSVWLAGATVEEAALFADALRDWMQPLGSVRYVLELPEGGCTSGETRVLPVPEVFGRNRSTADAFRRAWEAHAGRARLHYAVRGEGAELRARHLRTRWSAGRAWTRRVWA